MTPNIPTEAEIRLVLSRDTLHGQVPKRIVVPEGYDGPPVIDGIAIEMGADVDEPYIVCVDGERLGFDGCELTTSRATDLLARTIRGQVFTSIPGIRLSGW